MKRIASLLLASLMLCGMILSVSALNYKNDKFSRVFVELPETYKNATVISLGKAWTDLKMEGKTDAQHNTASGGGNKFDYVYMKKKDLGDFTIPFTVESDGVYSFAFKLMGWSKGVIRATDVYIDDAKELRIAVEYEDGNKNQYQNEYWYGITAELKAGQHTVSLSLPADFDDNTVKTQYFDSFMYVKIADLPAATTKPAAAVPASPATFDVATILCGVAMISAAGVIISKKRR